MKQGSVIVDMAAEAGGNCAVTQPGKLISSNGVTVIGVSFLFSPSPFPPFPPFSSNDRTDAPSPDNRLHRPPLPPPNTIINPLLKQHHQIPPLHRYTKPKPKQVQHRLNRRSRPRINRNSQRRSHPTRSETRSSTSAGGEADRCGSEGRSEGYYSLEENC
jgi:hypothetical protein